MEASPKPDIQGEQRPDLFVIPKGPRIRQTRTFSNGRVETIIDELTSETERSPGIIQLTEDGFLSPEKPDFSRVERFKRRVEPRRRRAEALLSDVSMMLRPRAWKEFHSPRPEEVAAFERVSERLKAECTELPVTFTDYRGNEITATSLFRPGRAHPERVAVVFCGLGGHPVNAAPQVFSEHLKDYSMLLVPRPGVEKQNNHLVWQPHYSIEEHIDNNIKYYLAAIQAVDQLHGIERLALVGHSLGGPYERLVRDRLHQQHPELYQALLKGGSIPEQTSGYGQMARESAFAGEDTRTLDRAAPFLFAALKKLGTTARSVDPHLPDGPLGRMFRSVAPQEFVRAFMSARYFRLKVGHEDVMDQDVIQASICAAKKQNWEFFITELHSTLKMPDDPRLYAHEVPMLVLRGQQDQLLSGRASRELTIRSREHRQSGHELLAEVAFPRGTHYVKAEKWHAEAVSELYYKMLTDSRGLLGKMHVGNRDPRTYTPRWYFHSPETVR